MSAGICRRYADLPVNRREIARYWCGNARAEVPELDAALAEARDVCAFSAVYEVFPLRVRGEGVTLGEWEICSRGLAKNLAGCDRAVLFAATAGIGLDRLIRRESAISPSRALLYQAIGAERVESLCDALCADLQKEFGLTRPRFSPGYGDLPLECQREIFRLLSPEKIGLTLSEGCTMSPSKSVTAFVGLCRKETEKG